MQKLLQNLNVISLCLNFLSAVSGMVYLIIPSNSHFWNFTGILFIFTIIFNCTNILYQGRKLDSNVKLVRKYRFSSYGYYCFVVLMKE